MALMKAQDRKPSKVHYQTNTKNKSFLKVWALLHAKGIENSLFFLKLYDKRLKDIDPYDDDLTVEEKTAVFNECSINKYYYIREVFRLPQNGSQIMVGGGVPFQLHRSNLAQLWVSDLNLNSYTIAPRQTGKTWGALADLSHSYQFTRGTSIIHFNKLQTDSNDNVGRMKDCLSLLPMYLQHSADEHMTSSDKRKVKNNEKYIKNIMGSTMIAMSSASNESKADAMARGKTAAKLWFDELAFLFFNKTILEAALPAFNKAAENADDAGNPYSIMITTTPGDLSAPHGTYAYNFMKGCIPFREQYYDEDYKNDHEKFIKKVKKSTHTNGFMFIQFHYYELGYTDEWYIKNTQALDPIKARREYLLEWINTSGNSPFEEDDIELLIGLARQKEKKEDIIPITKRFDLRVYSYYKGKLPVIISCDVAQGIGKDQNTMVAINPETLEPMAIFASNRISSTNFKKFLVKVVQKMYPFCIITIENNSIGTPLINELLETPIGRFIYREKKTRVVDMGVSKFGGKKRQEGMEYGHNVNTVSRPIMMNLLENMVKYSKQKLAIPEIVEEIQRMEWKNGRITHSNASHDDITMAYLGGLYIVKHGVNMRGRGIYFNISEDNDEKIDFEDIDSDFVMKANRTLREHNAKYYHNGDKNKFDSMIDSLLDGEEVRNPMNIKKRDYDQYRVIQDRLDGFDDDFEVLQSSIPRELESKILSGTQRMMHNLNTINSDKDDDYSMEDIFIFNKQRSW